MFDSRPLAERMRPVRLADYISQSHLVGEKGALRMQIEKGITPSLIFWHRKDYLGLHHCQGEPACFFLS